MLSTTSWERQGTEKLSASITRQMISGRDATLARIFLARGAIVPCHSHRSEQFSSVLTGALQLIFDDGEVVIHAREML